MHTNKENSAQLMLSSAWLSWVEIILSLYYANKNYVTGKVPANKSYVTGTVGGGEWR
jgi:hypothetical protein